jgi:hypothetical protein
MGLDIYHYGKKKEEVFIAEISQQLHTQIFYKNVDPGKWGILSKIKNYYGFEVTFNRCKLMNL